MDIIGACGDNCFFCPRYNVTISGDMNDLERVKELWVALGWRDKNVDVRELRCTGCGKENKCAYRELRDCVFGKGLENCGICPNYPCNLTNAAFERTEKAFSVMNVAGSKEEIDSLVKAFRHKKSNLDRIHNSRFGKKAEGISCTTLPVASTGKLRRG